MRYAVRVPLKLLKKRKPKRSAKRSATVAAPKKPAVSHHALKSQQLLAVKAKEALASWRLGEALELVDAALRIDPGMHKALQLRVSILSGMGRTTEAVFAAHELMGRYPLDIGAKRLMRALGVEPPHHTRDTALSVVAGNGWQASSALMAAQYLYDSELFEDALELCLIGLVSVARTTPEKKHNSIKHNLLQYKGLCLEGLHRYDAAIATYEAIVSDPAANKKASAGVARCLLELGQSKAAEAVLSASYAGDDDQTPFSPLLLDILQSQGKILESYQLYRKKPISVAISRYFNAATTPSDLNLCSGQYKDKRVLLLSEGGPGDELRLCSIYPDMKDHIGHLTITCDPRLDGIMSRTFPDIEFLPTTRHRREFVKDMPDRKNLTDITLFQCVSDQAIEAGQKADLVCSVLDTLADVRPSRESFRSRNVVIKPQPQLRAEWRRRIKTERRPQIGIAWRSILQTVARNRHYLDVTDLKGLGCLKDVDFWLLQPHATDDEIRQLTSFVNLRIPLGLDLVDDFEGQIAMISNLDMVISPFTTTGELAGAMGIRTLLLSTARNTMWRRNSDGTGIWRKSTQIVSGDPVHDREGAVARVVQIIEDQAWQQSDATL